MVEFINSAPEPEIFWCLLGLFGLLALGGIVHLLGSLVGDPNRQEAARIAAMNKLMVHESETNGIIESYLGGRNGGIAAYNHPEVQAMLAEREAEEKRLRADFMAKGGHLSIGNQK